MTALSKSRFVIFFFFFFLSIEQLTGGSAEYPWKDSYFQGTLRGSWKIWVHSLHLKGSPSDSSGKDLPANSGDTQEAQVQSLDQDDSLE